MYVKVDSEGVLTYPYSLTELVRSNRQTSFPQGMVSDELAAQWGVYPVQATPEPSFDPATQKVVYVDPVNVDGTWVQQWSVVALTPQEAATVESQTANDVRQQRDLLLENSDWTQVADAPVDKAAWAAYRQQLRDVPSQTGFPFNVVWPAKP